MSFNWLSDAELDPHPPFTWLTACCFDLAVRAVVRNAEIIPPDFRLVPGSLVVSNPFAIATFRCSPPRCAGVAGCAC